MDKFTFYGNNLDLGIFCLYRNNFDGTALFYQELEIGEEVNPVKIENRLVKYKWNSMFYYN